MTRTVLSSPLAPGELPKEMLCRSEVVWEGASRPGTTNLKARAREALGLGDDTVVLVSEMACTEPGCPPLETVVSVFPDGEESFLFKVRKPVAEVEEMDLLGGLGHG